MRLKAGRVRTTRGQTLAETALALPILLVLVLAIMVFGLYVFYNQQLANAAREAARYAAVHSSTAQCPTVSWLDPIDTLKPSTYLRCDPSESRWPRMTTAARSKIWGMNPTDVSFSACWSGYVDANNNYDALPQAPNLFTDCTINRIDPRTDPGLLACPAPATIPSAMSPAKADGDDKASDIAVAIGNNLAYPTVVTVYACTVWTPPLAGFVLIPNQVTLRAVISEALQRQQ